MPYNELDDKVANDALGPGYLNALTQNGTRLQGIFGAEHNRETGEHNAPNIARVVRRITNAPAISPSSSDITAVSNPATGQYTLTLAANRFDTNMQVAINVVPEVTKPHIATVKINSATSIDVFIKRLSSTLGVAGNSWAAQNTAFDIAIYSTPLDPGDWTYSSPAPWQRNAAPTYGLAGGASMTTPSYWSLLVSQQAELYARMTAEHTSAGAHNVRQIAQAAGLVFYDGTKYDSDAASLAAMGFGRTSAGIATITHGTYSTPVSNFACADFERTNGQSLANYIINVADSSSTVSTVYCFKWNSSGGYWESDDCDFWLAMHA